MQLDEQRILAVAKLARLELSPEEINFYKRELEKILDYVEGLQAVDLGRLESENERVMQVDPNPERPDLVQESACVEDCLAQAPKRVGTSFQVPKIIE